MMTGLARLYDDFDWDLFGFDEVQEALEFYE